MTKSDRFSEAFRNDSVLAALDVLPDRWSALVLREAFFGVRRSSYIVSFL